MEIYGNFFDGFAQAHSLDLARRLVHIEIELIRVCQQHCEYCFARNDGAKWGTIMKQCHLDALLDEMRQSRHPLRITLMGGETTLYPKLGELCTQLLDIPRVVEVEVFTNALRYVPLPPPVRVVASFHPRACLSEDKFKKTVLKYNKDHNLIVYIMTMLTSDAFPRMLSMHRWCQENGIKANLEYIFVEGGRLERYSGISGVDLALYREIDQDTRYVMYDGQRLSVDEFYRRRLNHFKGCQCWVGRLLKVAIEHPTEFRIECNAMGAPRVPISGYLAHDIEPITCTMDRCQTLADISTYKIYDNTSIQQ